MIWQKYNCDLCFFLNISNKILRISGKIILQHYLAQYGMIFIIDMHLASRGIERMDSYEKEDFKIFHDEDSGLNYWKLTKGGELKNHKDTDQDMDKGGRIYFQENSVGFNPGQYFEDFKKKLNPKNKYLIQRPQRKCKWFRLEENPTVW